MMSDKWTWEDRQDTLDYKQWKAEQDREHANREDHSDCVAAINRLVDEARMLTAEVARLTALVAELQAELEVWKHGIPFEGDRHADD